MPESEQTLEPEALPLPWYSFLYRLLGAQGTFWLWIAAVTALWWTAEPALIRLVNRTPQALAVDQVDTAAGTLTRWVQLEGVELTLDRRLLCAEEGDLAAPVILLVDPEDSAAQWWAETRRLADACVAAVTSGDVELQRGRARAGLQDRYVELTGEQTIEHLLPAPKQSVLVQDERTQSLQDVQPRETDRGALLDDFEREVDLFGELVRERVQVEVSIEGVLTDAPQVVLNKVVEELDVHAAAWLIQAGREPRDLESHVFAAAAIVLVFLAFGLFGASRVPTEAQESDDEAPPAPDPHSA